MDKYSQMCDYLEIHSKEAYDPDYIERIVKSYRENERWNRARIAVNFSKLIAKNKDYEAYRGIYGKPHFSEITDEVWYRREIGRTFKKNGDFDSMDVSFYFSHFQNNDDVVRKNIAVMKENALKKVYEKLNKPPLNYDIPFKFLEVRKCVYRKNFDEVIVTIGLRKDVMDLKERIEQVVI